MRDRRTLGERAGRGRRIRRILGLELVETARRFFMPVGCTSQQVSDSVPITSRLTSGGIDEARARAPAYQRLPPSAIRGSALAAPGLSRSLGPSGLVVHGIDFPGRDQAGRVPHRPPPPVNELAPAFEGLLLGGVEAAARTMALWRIAFARSKSRLFMSGLLAGHLRRCPLCGRHAVRWGYR
jgi:hypothetical protein